MNRNRVGWTDQRDRCKVFGMLWITVVLKILVVMASPLLGATKGWSQCMDSVRLWGSNSGLVPTFPHVSYSSLGVFPFGP